MDANAIFSLVGMLAMPLVVLLLLEAIASVAPTLARRGALWFQPDDGNVSWATHATPAWYDAGAVAGSGAGHRAHHVTTLMNSFPIRQA